MDERAGATLDLPAVNIDIQSTKEGMRAGMEIALDPATTIKDESAGVRHYPLVMQMFLDWETKQSKVQVVLDAVDFDQLAEKMPQIRQDQLKDLELNGTIVATLDANFMPLRAAVDLSIPQGQIQHNDLSAEAVPVRDVRVKAVYGNDEIQVEDVSATLRDVVVHASADLKVQGETQQEAGRYVSAADIAAVNGPVRLWIEDMPQSYIAPLWPKALEEENAKKWIVDRLSAGDLSGLLLTLDFDARKSGFRLVGPVKPDAVAPDQDPQEQEDDSIEAKDAKAVSEVIENAAKAQAEAGWDFNVKNLRAEFAFENMQVNYRDPLPPVVNAKGNGVFILDEEKLRISVEEGEMGGMQVHNAELVFLNIIEGGKGVADLKIPLTGPLVNAFEYISTEPIGLKDELGMDLSKVKGDA